jgi:hypothetical protein
VDAAIGCWMIAMVAGAVQGAHARGYYGVLEPLAAPRRPLRHAIALCALLPLLAIELRAQTVTGAPRDSATDVRTRAPRPPHYWRRVGAGFAASILAHEAAHVVTAIVVGGRPTIGLSKGRPTVFSGIDASAEPAKQFLFSSMGLNVQAAIDEAILDVPHPRGAPFERGVLAGGIATALFYITLGRTASVSDVDFMARTSSLSKTDISLIYGGVAIMHLVRIRANDRYADFFARPMGAGQTGLRVGVDLR